MRGSRCKALRRGFRTEHGRPPRGVRVYLQITPGRWVLAGEVSEWRRVKKAHKRQAQKGRKAA